MSHVHHGSTEHLVSEDVWQVYTGKITQGIAITFLIDKCKCNIQYQYTANISIFLKYIKLNLNVCVRQICWVFSVRVTWQVSVVLWCSLAAVNLILETAVTRRVFSTSRVDFSIPSLSTPPSPSSHVIWRKRREY